LKPPPDTIAGLSLAAATPGSSYSVVFTPVSSGPGGPSHSVVVKIGESRPVGSVKRAFPFAGRNVLVTVGSSSAAEVVNGRAYRGTLELVRQGEEIVPLLTAVSVE
jgi:hypothetical protein